LCRPRGEKKRGGGEIRPPANDAMLEQGVRFAPLPGKGPRQEGGIPRLGNDLVKEGGCFLPPREKRGEGSILTKATTPKAAVFSGTRKKKKKEGGTGTCGGLIKKNGGASNRFVHSAAREKEKKKKGGEAFQASRGGRRENSVRFHQNLYLGDRKRGGNRNQSKKGGKKIVSATQHPGTRWMRSSGGKEESAD